MEMRIKKQYESIGIEPEIRYADILEKLEQEYLKNVKYGECLDYKILEEFIKINLKIYERAPFMQWLIRLIELPELEEYMDYKTLMPANKIKIQIHQSLEQLIFELREPRKIIEMVDIYIK